jgi:hypothetical protein
MKKVWIYALTDNTGVRYIGQSKHPNKRYSEHLIFYKYSTSNYKDRWISKLIKNGEKPDLKILFWVPKRMSNLSEIITIKVFKLIGCKLTNGTSGGDFLYDRTGLTLTEDHKNKIKLNNGKSKKCIQLTLTGDVLKEWPSMKQAADFYNINRTHICYCCKGIRKTIGGYRWKYA